MTMRIVKPPVDDQLTKHVMLRFLQQADLSLLYYFASRLRQQGECWIWCGSLDKDGYGTYTEERKMRRPHKLSYEWKTGQPFPTGLVPDHLCRTPSCVNPDHIEPVTVRVNTLRGNAPSAVNAIKTHCQYGHPFDEANTRLVPGGRACKECGRRRVRDHCRRQRRAAGAPEIPRLNVVQVIEIRVAYAGGAKASALAPRYGVTKATIFRVVNRTTWKDVP